MQKNVSKANSRAKKMYQTWCNWPFIKKEDGKWRKCTSITEFLSLRWVKTYKENGERRFISDKLDAKRKNKKERIEAAKQIKEGIQEYEQDKEIYTCVSCVYCEDTYCHKHQKFLESDLPTCKYFVD